jgi:hypothetical protein
MPNKDIKIWGNRTLAPSDKEAVVKISSRIIYEHIKEKIVIFKESGAGRQDVVEAIQKILLDFLPKTEIQIDFNDDPELIVRNVLEAQVSISSEAQPYIDAIQELFDNDDFQNSNKKK